jgi:hypothetical protein
MEHWYPVLQQPSMVSLLRRPVHLNMGMAWLLLVSSYPVKSESKQLTLIEQKCLKARQRPTTKMVMILTTATDEI